MWIETPRTWRFRVPLPVTPHVGVWIETLSPFRISLDYCVTPHVGVWIETLEENLSNQRWRSHLM